MQNNTIRHGSCHAFLSIKKNKMKTYGSNTYYLNDGQEFELGLSNFTTSTVVAMILMNGKQISRSGLVIKPGQTVTLERFIDENKKFLFETYTIDNSPEGLKAIQNNGDIEVKFYKERELNTYTAPINDWFNFSTTGSTTIGSGVTNTCYSSTTTGISKSLTSRKRSASKPTEYASMSFMADEAPEEKYRETGRVEKGSNSDQKFGSYTGDFESWAFQTTSLKLLPMKYKPVEISELATYCVNCGTKNKKGNYRYCPKCGTKY